MPSRFAWESGRHPFEVLLHIWAVMNGALYLVGAVDRPNSIRDALPLWVQVAWFALLLAGGLTGLIAAWLQGRVRYVEQGLRVEGGALCFLVGGVLLYTCALFTANGMNAFGAGTITGTYGLACLWRLRHIRKESRGVT